MSHTRFLKNLLKNKFLKYMSNQNTRIGPKNSNLSLVFVLENFYFQF